MAKSLVIPGFGKGIVRNVHPKRAPLDSAFDIQDLRFDQDGLSQEFAEATLGSAASKEILAILDHVKIGTISGNPLDGKLLRITGVLFPTPGDAITIESWNPGTASWDTEVNSTPNFENASDEGLVDAISIQGQVVIAPWLGDGGIPHPIIWDTALGTLDFISDLSQIPGRFLGSFGDRLIVLWDGFDSQSYAWSVDGNITDFSGTGSGQIFLVDSHYHPIDALQGVVPIAENVQAVFRQRSIMRAFETGFTGQSIGVVPWLAGPGTESPYSITKCIGGAMFLGHDRMPYYLSVQGTVPVGEGIRESLLADLESDLGRVQGAYDPVLQQYWLGIPVDGASTLSIAWVFDVGRFVARRELRWRKVALSNVKVIASASQDSF